MNAAKFFYHTKNSEPLKVYAVFSFIAAAVLFLQEFTYTWRLEADSFLMSLFVVGHYVFLEKTQSLPSKFEAKTYYPALFLFQTIMLPLMAYQQQDPAYLFFAVIPCSASTFFELSENQRFWRWSVMARTTYLTSIFCLLFFVLELSRFSLFEGVLQKGVNMLVFMVWTQALISLAFSHQRQKQKMQSQVKERSGISALSDQYFYHDAINVTHGLLLFLKQKLSKDVGLDTTEVSLIVHEIESLQSYLNDYFPFAHKNLKKVKTLVSFTEARTGLYSLVHSFLNESEIRAVMIFQGLLEESHPERDQVIVHYPTLHRIFANLIKNVHEHKPEQVEIIFSADRHCFQMIVKNPVRKQLQKNEELEKSLGKLILQVDFEEGTKNFGVGLDSVQELAESFGGEFHCHIEDGLWVSRVTLPHPESYTANMVSKKVA